MGTFSIWHWVIVLVIVLVLFGGRGKISQLMGDFGKGLNSFKKQMKDGENNDDDDAKQISGESANDASAGSKDKTANS
mgnify:CR=1 FL=1|uniref:twin-arginine translocase TatA/TatE family subunit n=1 Tax=Aestuariispira ectoiniformans TaxID=2775080 RepID=UPI0021E4F8D8|nr:twin-arginine translocase TatA/TatE family subunit [Aestuariispira ectoiniformans]